MAETKSERKVAVILATDVVGYSSMMEENERVVYYVGARAISS